MDDALRIRKDTFEIHYGNMISEIQKSLSNGCLQSQRLSIAYIEAALHSLMDYWEKLIVIPNVNFSQELQDTLTAYRFANDKLKHAYKDGYIKPVNRVITGFQIPYAYPTSFGVNSYFWINLDSFVEANRKTDPGRLTIYKQKLENKDIRSTFASVKKMLDEVNLFV